MAHIPLWGYAEVVAAESDAVKPGDRVFGYLPSASHLLVNPSQLGGDRFRDAAPHRGDLMPIYNEYTVVTGAPRSPESENLTALSRPLFMTSFAFEAFAAANEWFGARRLLISSASSKTGYGIAKLAHSQRSSARSTTCLRPPCSRKSRAGIAVRGKTSKRCCATTWTSSPA
jgi:hypothetical protein